MWVREEMRSQPWGRGGGEVKQLLIMNTENHCVDWGKGWGASEETASVAGILMFGLLSKDLVTIV